MTERSAKATRSQPSSLLDMLVPSPREGLWGLSGAPVGALRGPGGVPLWGVHQHPGVSTHTGAERLRPCSIFQHFSGLKAAPLAERHVSVTTGGAGLRRRQLYELWKRLLLSCVIPAAFQPLPSTEGRKAGQREAARTFITSWGFTGDAHMHAGAHTHTPHRVDFTVEKCADLQ